MMHGEFTLEPGEDVLLEVRRHWLVFVLDLVPFAVAALLPLLLSSLLPLFAASLPAASNIAAFNLSFGEPVARLILGLWWLLMWTAAFTSFTRSYLDVWVVTTSRIANIKQQGFFNRRIESFLLVRVQDVTTEVAGIIPTLFGIGSVRVETAGDASRAFRMRGLPDPEEVRDLIIREAARLHGNAPDRASLT